MMIDPFKDGFTLTQLSQAINALPNMYSRVASLNLFKWRPQTGKTATIEMRNGVLRLVPTTPWGGVPPKNQSGKPNIRSFNIPHMPLEDTVLASDVIGVRAFGTENTFEPIAQRVNDKLQEMKNKIDQTMEWRMLGALRGEVLDYDGTVLENYFTAFGITNQKFPPINTDAILLADTRIVPWFMPGSKELADSVRVPLAASDAILLTSHGVLTVDAASLEEALLKAAYVEEIAEIYYHALLLSGGKEPATLPAEDLVLQYPAAVTEKK